MSSHVSSFLNNMSIVTVFIISNTFLLFRSYTRCRTVSSNQLARRSRRPTSPDPGPTLVAPPTPVVSRVAEEHGHPEHPGDTDIRCVGATRWGWDIRRVCTAFKMSKTTIQNVSWLDTVRIYQYFWYIFADGMIWGYMQMRAYFQFSVSLMHTTVLYWYWRR